MLHIEQMCFSDCDTLTSEIHDRIICKNNFFFACEENLTKNMVAILKAEKRDDSFVEMCALAVLKEFRANGIASSLINQLKSETKNSKIILFVDTTNVKAIALYKKHGFTITSIKANYFKNKNSAFMMEYSPNKI